jgi:hypothetical protein
VEFVVFDVEHGVELSDVENVVDFLGEVEEFEFASGVADGGEATDEFADTRAIDVVDADEIEDDFFLALRDKAVDGIAELVDLVAEDDAPVDIEDGDGADFAGFDDERHDECSAGMVVGGKGWSQWEQVEIHEGKAGS